MSANFPRLLIATEFPPNAGGGGAAIVRQMLKNWPVEKLFWWSSLPDRDQHFGRQVAGHRVASIPPKWMPNRKWRRARTWLMETFWVPRATRHLRQTLAEVQPEVVWAIPHAWSILPLAQVLPGSGSGFHVSVHDYPDLKNQIEGLGADRCRRWAVAVEQLYARAATRDAICQPMLDDLRARTNVVGTMARAGLEPEDFAYLSAKTATPDGVIRIAYPGSIIVEKEFALFVQVLARIRRQLPRPVSLEFFGDHSYRSRGWFDPAWMTMHGNLPAAELLAALKKCTLGFAPMGLTDDDSRYNRFSLPTKFVSYLQAGLPVILLGHPQSSVMQTAGGFRPGLCWTGGDEEAFSRELLAVLSLPNPWREFGPGLMRCARAGFDAQQMRQTLVENFQKCAAASTRQP
jgi:glycosyltransferase involved in cell wall biosynthesis